MRKYLCALLNSTVFKYIFGQLNPTLNFQSGEVAKFPVIRSEGDKERIDDLSYQNVKLSKCEYDSFETSWNFERNPMLPVYNDGPGFAYKMENLPCFLGLPDNIKIFLVISLAPLPIFLFLSTVMLFLSFFHHLAKPLYHVWVVVREECTLFFIQSCYLFHIIS